MAHLLSEAVVLTFLMAILLPLIVFGAYTLSSQLYAVVPARTREERLGAIH